MPWFYAQLEEKYSRADGLHYVLSDRITVTAGHVADAIHGQQPHVEHRVLFVVDEIDDPPQLLDARTTLFRTQIE